MQKKFFFNSNLVLPDTYRLDYEAFFYIELIVNIYEANIVEYSKSYSSKIKSIIFDKITDDNNNVDDYDTKINQEKIKRTEYIIGTCCSLTIIFAKRIEYSLHEEINATMEQQCTSHTTGHK